MVRRDGMNLYTVDTNESLPTCQLPDLTVPDPNSVNARSNDPSPTKRTFLAGGHDQFRAIYTSVFLLMIQLGTRLTLTHCQMSLH